MKIKWVEVEGDYPRCWEVWEDGEFVAYWYDDHDFFFGWCPICSTWFRWDSPGAVDQHRGHRREFEERYGRPPQAA